MRKNYPLQKNSIVQNFPWENFIDSYQSCRESEFYFLNLRKRFENAIDWNFAEYGKLWTYNLSYFEYLNQRDMTKEEGLRFIGEFIKNINNIKDGMEPYPISLRGINWIKFLNRFGISDKNINDSLYAQYYILLDNLEYHLLGNHLLENGFSLFWGGIFFKDDRLLRKGKEIIYQELQEQILDDGAHFELSPMYHKIILFRLLDSINLLENNKKLNDDEFVEFLREKASLMITWLKNISFKNYDFPLLNDSALNIAPKTHDLLDYAKSLQIDFLPTLQLKSSGYRKISKSRYECIVDVGKIGPDYIPGHAHADTFNFVVHIENTPFIIDTGISTYEAGKTRDYERSTKAHNTVEINDANSSEVWGSFRVANRAKVVKLQEDDDFIQATHDGYCKKFGILHTRKWYFWDSKIVVEDQLNKKANAVFRLYFHPDVSIDEIKKRIKAENFEIKECLVAFEYNKRVKSKVLEIPFEKELKVEIIV